MMDVALGIVKKENKFLLIERVKQEDSLTWAFPGGKKESIDKHLEATAIREVFQETGIWCNILKKLGNKQNGRFNMHYFLCEYLAGELKFKPDEVKQGGWFLKEEIYQKTTSSLFPLVKQYFNSI